MTAARQPSNVPAHWMCRLLNICREKSGNPAATKDLRKVFAAIAEAALFEVNLSMRQSIEARRKVRGKTYNMRYESIM
jgi:hypothetical protein